MLLTRAQTRSSGPLVSDPARQRIPGCLVPTTARGQSLNEVLMFTLDLARVTALSGRDIGFILGAF